MARRADSPTFRACAALLGLACALALAQPGAAEGAGKRRSAPKPAPPHKRVALLAPEHTGQTRAVVAALLQAAERDLAKGGFEVLSQAKVAAVFRKKRQAVPYCSDAVPCLSRVGDTLGTGFVLTVVASSSGEGVDAALTIVDAGRASLVTRDAIPGITSAVLLPDLPSPTSAIYRYIGEQETRTSAAEPIASEPVVTEPVPAEPEPEPKKEKSEGRPEQKDDNPDEW